MNETPNYELFYDVLDKTVLILYEIKHAKFFDLLIQTSKNILAGEVVTEDATPQIIKRLNRFYSKLEDINFSAEEVRKAFQIMVLRGFKEENLNNGDITPDTLGIFMTYLITKLCPEKKSFKILDPLIGTGNLLFTVANHLDKEIKLFGIDNEYRALELATVLGDLLDYNVEMYHQDTLTHPFSDMDIVVSDIPGYEYQNHYFPYLCILEHLSSLKDDGYFLALVPDDFFDHDKDGFFKEGLKKVGSVLGVLELPETMFKANRKSLLIFSRKPLESKKCLLTSLPSFTDIKKLNIALNEIELWFENNINN